VLASKSAAAVYAASFAASASILTLFFFKASLLSIALSLCTLNPEEDR
jgi:hypothetical protein